MRKSRFWGQRSFSCRGQGSALGTKGEILGNKKNLLGDPGEDFWESRRGFGGIFGWILRDFGAGLGVGGGLRGAQNGGGS